MDERGRQRTELLPEASDSFVRGMLDGARAIRRERRRRERLRRLSLAAAAVLLLAAGLGYGLNRLRAPRPDNVALSVSPERVAAPDPEPTQAPLPVDWAFRAGEWLCLTAEPETDFDAVLNFRERPAENARCVPVAAGIQVRFLGDAGSGFSRVRYAGMDGYVRTDELRRGEGVPALDPEGVYVLDGATMTATDSLGALHCAELPSDAARALLVLQRLLDELAPAAPGLYDDAPFGARLLLTLSDAAHPEREPVRRCYTLPRDGTLALLDEDGGVHTLPDSHLELFWSLFPEVAERLW